MIFFITVFVISLVCGLGVAYLYSQIIVKHYTKAVNDKIKSDYIIIKRSKEIMNILDYLRETFKTDGESLGTALRWAEYIEKARQNHKTVIVMNGVMGIVQEDHQILTTQGSALTYTEENSKTIN